MLMGWVKLHREILEKAIWKCSTPEQKVVLMTILMLANHKENQWIWRGRKFKCLPGQFITSLKSLASYGGVSIKNVRTALIKFEKLEFMANETASDGRLITILNWDRYQQIEIENGKPLGKLSAKGGQAIGKEVATNNKDKKDNNDKNEINILFDHFWNLYDKKVGDKAKCKKKWDSLTDQEREKTISMLPEWKKTLDKQFQPHPYTYLNGARWNDEIILPDQKKKIYHRGRSETSKSVKDIIADQFLDTEGMPEEMKTKYGIE